MTKPRYVYRVITRLGTVWCKTSDPDEAREALLQLKGAKLERCYSVVSWSSWERWDGEDDGA